MNLIIIEQSELSDDRSCLLADERATHILSVLKCEPGDSIEIGIVDGGIGRTEITAIEDRMVTLELGEMKTPELVRPEIDLVCALPRPQTVKKVLLTAAMMNVRRMDFIRTNRVERSFYQSPLLAPDNLRRHLIDGLAQGKHTRLPIVTIHERFRPFFEDHIPQRDKAESVESRLKLLPDLDATEPVSAVYDKVDALQVAIGPEGGWVPFEVELMQSLGFKPVTLGRSVLRVETAVTAALSQLELLRMQG